ncbi:MAG: type II toxin-antitoxin system HicB family antitoxin [Pyrinomonadaceae bacterium]
MNNILTYKGFTAKIGFSSDDNVFFGRVLGIPEIVSFHATNVSDLKKEMAGMIDFYLESCEKKGKKPKKSYSGKMMLRLSNELHARIAEAAAQRGISINEFGKEVLEKAVQN